MSDFIFWNIIFLIAWMLFNIVRWSLPKGVVFSVVSRGRSRTHGTTAVVLINDKRETVFCSGRFWRYKKDGRILPEEWADILDS